MKHYLIKKLFGIDLIKLHNEYKDETDILSSDIRQKDLEIYSLKQEEQKINTTISDLQSKVAQYAHDLKDSYAPKEINTQNLINAKDDFVLWIEAYLNDLRREFISSQASTDINNRISASEYGTHTQAVSNVKHWFIERCRAYANQKAIDTTPTSNQK